MQISFVMLMEIFLLFSDKALGDAKKSLKGNCFRRSAPVEERLYIGVTNVCKIISIFNFGSIGCVNLGSHHSRMPSKLFFILGVL